MVLYQSVEGVLHESASRFTLPGESVTQWLIRDDLSSTHGVRTWGGGGGREMMIPVSLPSWGTE